MAWEPEGAVRFLLGQAGPINLGRVVRLEAFISSVTYPGAVGILKPRAWKQLFDTLASHAERLREVNMYFDCEEPHSPSSMTDNLVEEIRAKRKPEKLGAYWIPRQYWPQSLGDVRGLDVWRTGIQELRKIQDDFQAKP